MKPTVDAVIVGSGLAGLTAALKLSQNNYKVTILEKTARLGGNSMKASSGINGVPTRFQKSPDTVENFVSDTLKSGKGLNNPALVDILTSRSASSVNWLVDEIGVDLLVVTQMGGHSAPRTHRGAGKLPPGVAIISALVKELENYPNLTILKEAPLVKIVKDSNEVKGVQYSDKDGNVHSIESSNVVLASGGFSADFTDSSLIKKYRPDLFHFPLTNGEQTTGDGQKIAERDVDAKLIHMDQIQVHPTGFVNVDPEKFNNRWKFLCGELMRGIGGILVSPQGKRFVNELDTRDKVSSAILDSCSISSSSDHQSIAFLLVSDEDYKKAQHHIDFYSAVGLIHKVDLVGAFDFIKKFNPNLEKDALTNTLQNYNSGVSTKDEFNRPVFGSKFGKEFYIGAVTPVLHFDMGGIAIDENAHVITNKGETISSLYAIGEVSGGVHGGNRLGGSSLLECVVFGAIAAEDIIKKS